MIRRPLSSVCLFAPPLDRNHASLPGTEAFDYKTSPSWVVSTQQFHGSAPSRSHVERAVLARERLPICARRAFPALLCFAYTSPRAAHASLAKSYAQVKRSAGTGASFVRSNLHL